MKKYILCLMTCFAVIIPFVAWGLLSNPDPGHSEEILSVRAERSSAQSPAPADAGSFLEITGMAQAEATVQYQKVAYNQAVQSAQVTEYITAIQAAEAAEQARIAEEQRVRSSSPYKSAAPMSGGTTVGECTGFAIPDYIIQRESGGDPSAMNPSGAYGCAQTLLSHYSGGSCSGLDPYSIDGQRECVNILSNGGTNLAPWAATR